MKFRNLGTQLISSLALCGAAAAPMACSSDHAATGPDGGTRTDGGSDASKTHPEPKPDSGHPTTKPDAGHVKPDSGVVITTPDSSAGPGSPDAAIDSGASTDSGSPTSTCGKPVDPAKAKLCLTFSPETITFGATGDLDGKGVYIITVFDGPDPAKAHPLAQTIYPPQHAPGEPDAGPSEVSVTAPLQIDVDVPVEEADGAKLPTYVYTLFVDNPAYFGKHALPLVYGTWLGGLNFSHGLVPSVQLNEVALNAGAGTPVNQKLLAMRRFTTTVSLDLPDSGSKLPTGGDGTGTVQLGIYRTTDPTSTTFGAGLIPCADGHVTTPAEGFFYGSGATFITGLLDDFGLLSRTSSPPGAVVALTSVAGIPSDQAFNVPSDAYTVAAPPVFFQNFTFGAPPANTADVLKCPHQ